ncbi:co-chaperone GroES, partial [Patescibacteria group bacterium]|nr:co-chaperone GroES [Patescibacteria group bacterium]
GKGSKFQITKIELKKLLEQGARYTVEKEKPEQGKIIAIGRGRKMASGKIIPLEVKVGDKIIFTKYGPNEIKVDGKEYLIAKEEDILAIIE